MQASCSARVRWRCGAAQRSKRLTSTSFYFLLNPECFDCAHIGRNWIILRHIFPQHTTKIKHCRFTLPWTLSVLQIYLHALLLTLQTLQISAQWYGHIEAEQLSRLLTWIQRSARTGATQSTASVSLLGLSLLTLQLLLLNTALLAANWHSAVSTDTLGTESIPSNAENVSCLYIAVNVFIMLFCNPVFYMQTVKKAHCVSQIYERTVKKKKNSKEEEEEEEALKKKRPTFSN